ncbi:hypothetical protein H9W90_08015 [Polaribacter pectinis]|uniref:TonB C-terminal domain-containing protein n=1 Tax=Polaribacter pectinis TaxID=2738844 RepID=A0A7G9L6A9_9FLAO|nr:energy transducer TonB [Polaribacter pectinis]QNM84158.1 hypothetical protein H9W90_08015 [Polaribacter pectinis]
MKKLVSIAILLVVAFSTFSQTNSFYKPGDTLYYLNNRATYLKTNTLVIIKEANVAKNTNTFRVEKHLLDTDSNTYVLDSKFITNGLQQLRSNGVYKSYHKNGNIASEGETINGKKSEGIWTYYYENGKKKSEEKLSNDSFFRDQKINLVMSFWDDKGNQTVKNGNGFAQFLSEKDGLFRKGSFKGGLKNGTWTAFKNKTKVFEETYKKGKLVKGTSWNDKGESFDYKEVYVEAYYKKQNSGSVEKYVDKNFNSNTAGVIGNIYATFTVTKEGNVTNVEVIRGLTQDYNSEVTKVLSEMTGWTPAKKRGQSLESSSSLNLNFKG